MSYAVAIVVDRDFGDRLGLLADRLHVWVCATEPNCAAARSYWRSNRNPQSIEHGVTTFNVDAVVSPEQMLIDVLSMVDLHHGEYSHDPPWDTIEVYGARPEPLVRSAFADFGVAEFMETRDGFVGRR